jgi:hypothetical protein
MDTVTIPGSELVPIIKQTLESGSDFRLLVTGSSMRPFLKNEKDSVLLTAVSNVGIKKGEIVFIQRESGAYVLHRVIKLLPNDQFIMNGDAQTWTERVAADRVFACVKTIYRKERAIGHKNPLYVLLTHVWILLRPHRPKIFRMYARLLKLIRH